MSDYSELKRLAEAAKPDDDSPYLPCPVALMNAVTPSAVLALIAENERLAGECEGCPMSIAEALRIERDQLKAENEALRHDAELYRFVSQLAWYVDRAAQVYDIGNQSAQWSDERQAVDADEVQAAICAVMSQGEQA